MRGVARVADADMCLRRQTLGKQPEQLHHDSLHSLQAVGPQQRDLPPREDLREVRQTEVGKSEKSACKLSCHTTPWV